MKEFNSELYVAGSLSAIGGIPASRIAKWNGQQWCSLGSVFDNTALCLEVYNNELYVGGGFWTIDGDSVHYIAKWIGGSYVDSCSAVGINEINNDLNSFSLSPNPSTNNLIVNFSHPLTSS